MKHLKSPTFIQVHTHTRKYIIIITTTTRRNNKIAKPLVYKYIHTYVEATIRIQKPANSGPKTFFGNSSVNYEHGSDIWIKFHMIILQILNCFELKVVYSGFESTTKFSQLKYILSFKNFDFKVWSEVLFLKFLNCLILVLQKKELIIKNSRILSKVKL